MANKNDCSMNDTKQLRDLIVDNPDLPLLIFASEESWSGEYRTEQANVRGCVADEMILYDDRWMDRDDFEQALRDDMRDCDKYIDLSADDFCLEVEKIIDDSKFVKAIIIFV